MWEWLANNIGLLGILIPLIPIVWSSVQYLRMQRNEIKHRRFKTYHQLIKDLVQREEPDQAKKLDRQIAIIFELRNFKEYYPVSLRILKGLKISWANSDSEDHCTRLHEELDESINHIKKKI